jgi:hypothetical protein
MTTKRVVRLVLVNRRKFTIFEQLLIQPFSFRNYGLKFCISESTILYGGVSAVMAYLGLCVCNPELMFHELILEV